MKLEVSNCMDCPAHWEEKDRCRINRDSCNGKLIPKECPLLEGDITLTMPNKRGEVELEEPLKLKAGK